MMLSISKAFVQVRLKGQYTQTGSRVVLAIKSGTYNYKMRLMRLICISNILMQG